MAVNIAIKLKNAFFSYDFYLSSLDLRFVHYGFYFIFWSIPTFVRNKVFAILTYN